MIAKFLEIELKLIKQRLSKSLQLYFRLTTEKNKMGTYVNSNTNIVYPSLDKSSCSIYFLFRP